MSLGLVPNDDGHFLVFWQGIFTWFFLSNILWAIRTFKQLQVHIHVNFLNVWATTVAAAISRVMFSCWTVAVSHQGLSSSALQSLLLLLQRDAADEQAVFKSPWKAAIEWVWAAAKLCGQTAGLHTNRWGGNSMEIWALSLRGLSFWFQNNFQKFSRSFFFFPKETFSGKFRCFQCFPFPPQLYKTINLFISNSNWIFTFSEEKCNNPCSIKILPLWCYYYTVVKLFLDDC